MSLSPSSLKQALSDAKDGKGIPPGTCEALLLEGLVEWVDHTTGMQVDLVDPRSILRLTSTGEEHLQNPGDHTTTAANEPAVGQTQK